MLHSAASTPTVQWDAIHAQDWFLPLRRIRLPVAASELRYFEKGGRGTHDHVMALSHCSGEGCLGYGGYGGLRALDWGSG